MKSDKRKVTFLIPKNMQKELNKRIVNDGYSLREKYKWISEAVDKFLNIKNYPELVKYGSEMKGLDSQVSIQIDMNLNKKVEQAIIKIRESFPSLEAVRSKLFRAAIVQRLLRESPIK